MRREVIAPAVVRKATAALLKVGHQEVFNYGEPAHVDYTMEGHTDNVGAKSANQTLSEKRAEAVVAWLADHHIARTRVAAAGFGDAKPIQDNSTEEGRAKNCRVELAKR